MIKVICFDLDGVFFSTDNNAFVENLSKRFSLEKKLVKEVLFERYIEEGRFKELTCGKIPQRVWWDYIFGNLNIEDLATKNDYLVELGRVRKINPEVASFIKKVRDAGYKTAVCSNNYKDNIDFLKKKFKLVRFFDIMVFSYEVGVLKPDKKIFQELIKRSLVKPNEIIYSDDKEINLKEARKLGIHTFHFQNFGQFKSELNNLGLELTP